MMAISIARWIRPGAVLSVAATLFTAACIGTPEEFQNTGVIVFENSTQASMIDVRVAICSDTSYGENRMGDLLEVPPGREFRVRISPGCYDSRLGFVSGTVVARTGIMVSEDEETTVRITSLGN
jgi:hypothetical protein